MLNKWKKFQDYIAAVNHVSSGKRDTTYWRQFTFDTPMGFEGLSRVLTILARRYLFYLADSSLTVAWRKKAIQFQTPIFSPGTKGQ